MITDQTLINILEHYWPTWENDSGFSYLGNRRWACGALGESWNSLADMLKHLDVVTRAAPPDNIRRFYVTVCIANDAYMANEL